MKFVVAVDCEGEACVVGASGHSLTESGNWDFARRQATREANAAAQGLFDAGAQQVIIWDNHYRGLNLFYEELDERCDIILGARAQTRWPGVDKSFTGIVLVGYHSMDNVADAVLAHSYSSADYQWIKINGQEVGEIAVDAAMAGDLGVPVIFVSSDEAGATEAKRFLPWVETVATKRGLGWNMALSKHPVRAAKEIRQGAQRAAARIKEMKTFQFASPLTMEYRFKRLDGAEMFSRTNKTWKRTDAYTCQKQMNRMSDEY